MKNPTIHDVARLAGVSTATVSNVLNERAGEVSAQLPGVFGKRWNNWAM